jgi:hypothetical protein
MSAEYSILQQYYVYYSQQPMEFSSNSNIFNVTTSNNKYKKIEKIPFHIVCPQCNKTTTQQTIEMAENTKKPRE